MPKRKRMVEVTDANIHIYVDKRIAQLNNRTKPVDAVPPLQYWDVSKVTNMRRLFARQNTDLLLQTDDITEWDVSNVRTMAEMFRENKTFSQDIGGWNVSKVTDMSQMFDNCVRFNHSIENWNVHNVTNMELMFYMCDYDLPLNGWDVSHVTNMNVMFGYSKFNQPLDKWNVSSVVTAENMFVGNRFFNQSLIQWQFPPNVDCSEMFYRAVSFDQPETLRRWIRTTPSIAALDFEDFLFNTPLYYNEDLPHTITTMRDWATWMDGRELEDAARNVETIRPKLSHRGNAAMRIAGQWLGRTDAESSHIKTIQDDNDAIEHARHQTAAGRVRTKRRGRSSKYISTRLRRHANRTK